MSNKMKIGCVVVVVLFNSCTLYYTTADIDRSLKLNKEQKGLIEELRASLGQGGKSHSPRQTSWFEGVKNFFDDLTT